MIFQTEIDERKINGLARKYKILDYTKKLRTHLKEVYPREDFANCSKFELHQILNETLLRNYNGEEILKYKLFQNFIDKENVTAAFEIKVQNSRLDFLTINGKSTSFEIKSGLDNLTKLTKQISDYQLVFEYNYVVLDEKHLGKAESLLPESYGLWSYSKGEYLELRKAELNQQINPKFQLKLLSKRELFQSFPEQDGNADQILKQFDAKDINQRFKKILKKRYYSRWKFLVENKMEILPIDVQFFFKTKIKPQHIYFH